MSSSKLTLQILVALLFVVGAGALLYAARALPRAGPASAVRFHADALGRGDLADLQESSTKAVFLRYQTQASRPVLDEARALYHQRIPELARPIWREIRDQARAEAASEYEALREKVVSLGRAHYQQLGASERSRIIESGLFNRFVFEAGVERLPAEERRRVPDPTAFFFRRDRHSYLDRESWRHVPEEEKTRLESARALDGEDTPEKLRFFDKVAAPELTVVERKMLTTVSRGDSQSLDRFVSVHGERVLAERLSKNPPRVAGIDQLDCSSPAFDRGSLLHGPLAVCRARGGTPVFVLGRISFEWLVNDVSGLAVGPEE